MGHLFPRWMPYWARMVYNRYGLLIKEHGCITRSLSRLRSARALRSLRAAAEVRAVSPLYC